MMVLNCALDEVRALRTTRQSDTVDARMKTYTATQRSKLRRLPKRGADDHETIHRILDEGLICHIGFVVEGQPFVIPPGRRSMTRKITCCWCGLA